MMKSINYYAFFTFFGILFLLILYKVIAVPITHDEVPAAMFYSRFSFWEIMMYPDNIPNNHILNTLSAKLSIMIFGREQWAIRLPNLFSFIVFAIGVFRIVKTIIPANSYFFLPAAILFINPYLLDFFGLCRGYGMSNAFLVLSVSYLISGFLNSKNKHIWLALFFSVLASYANFTLLVFWLACTLMVWFYFLKNAEKGLSGIWKPTFIITFISLLYLALIAVPIYKMHSTNEFQYWTSKGFYKETILSLVHNWKYGSEFLEKIKSGWISSFLFLVLLANVVVAFFQYRKSGWKIGSLKHPAFVSTALILLTAFSNIIQALVLRTPNLNGRTALFFYPLFAASFVALIALAANSTKQLFRHYLPLAILFLLLVNFASRFTLKSVKEWSYDQDNLAVADYLKDEYNGHAISLKTSWFFNPSLRFYADTGKIPWIDLYAYDRHIDVNTEAEYYYIFSDDYKLLESRFDVVFKFSSDRWLLKRKDF